MNVSHQLEKTAVGSYTVSTVSCYHNFSMYYETIVWHKSGENVVRAQQYTSLPAAMRGHVKWVNFCKDFPTHLGQDELYPPKKAKKPKVIEV